MRFGFCDFSLWYSWDLDFGISDFGFLYLRFEDWICRVWELWIRDVFMSLAMLLHCVPPLSPRRVSSQLARLPSAFACLRVARDSQPGRAPLVWFSAKFCTLSFCSAPCPGTRRGLCASPYRPQWQEMTVCVCEFVCLSV